jgi:hypothetical protein
MLKISYFKSTFLFNRSNGGQLKVRMGEWDGYSNSEPITHQEFNVARIFVHPQFAASTLVSSVAILRLSSNVPLGQVPSITTACLSGTSLSGQLRKIVKIFILMILFQNS